MIKHHCYSHVVRTLQLSIHSKEHTCFTAKVPLLQGVCRFTVKECRARHQSDLTGLACLSLRSPIKLDRKALLPMSIFMGWMRTVKQSAGTCSSRGCTVMCTLLPPCNPTAAPNKGCISLKAYLEQSTTVTRCDLQALLCFNGNTHVRVSQQSTSGHVVYQCYVQSAAVCGCLRQAFQV